MRQQGLVTPEEYAAEFRRFTAWVPGYGVPLAFIGSGPNGGDLDWGPSARYVKPFADTVTKLPKGQTTTAPVKTDFGYHVIRVDDVRPLKVPEFSEVKEQFRQRAQQQQIQKMVMDLRSKAKIEDR